MTKQRRTKKARECFQGLRLRVMEQNL